MTPEQKREWWGDGPWVDEQDRIEFRCEGLPCLMRRHPTEGHWCGYVAVPPGHPLHGVTAPGGLIAHGGVNYASYCSDSVCHVPEPGEPDNVWWFGFDCMHFGDLVPQHLKLFGGFEFWVKHVVYREQPYVAGVTMCLANQLAAVARGAL